MADQFSLDFNINVAQLDRLVATLDRVTTTATQSANAMGEVEKNASTKKAVDEAEKFIASLKRQADEAGKTKSEIMALRAAQMGMTDQAAPMIAQLKKAEEGMHGLNLSTVGARRELMVLAHEASQGSWKNFGGSLMVMAEQMDLTKAIMSPLGLAIGATAGVLALFGIAALKGAAEYKGFNDALILTNSYAGVTVGKLSELATAASKSTGDIHQAKEATLLLAQSGRFTATEIAKIAPVITEMAHVSGQEIDKIVEDFTKLSKEPSKAVVELNEKFHFLTVEILNQIIALEKHGRTQEAAALAEKTYADAMGKRTKEILENQGWLVRGWHAVANEAKMAWDEMLGIGKPKTAEDGIARLQKQLDDKKTQYQQSKDSGMGSGGLNQIQGEIDTLTKQLGLAKTAAKPAQEKAAAQSKKDQEEDAKIAATTWMETFKKQFANNKEKAKEEKEAFMARATTLNYSPEQIKKGIHDIDEKYKDTSGIAAAKHTENVKYQTALEEQRQLARKAVEDYRTAEEDIKIQLNNREITYAEYLNKMKAAKDKELNDEIKYTEAARQIALKHGEDGKREAARMLGEIQTFEQQKKTAQKKLEADQAQHNTEMKNLNQRYADDASAYNTKLMLESKKANDRQFRTRGESEWDQKKDSITAHYSEQFARVNRESDDKHATPKERDEALFTVDQAQTQALTQEKKSMNDRIDMQSDWRNGARLATKQYVEDSKNAAAQTAQAFSNAYQSMEDMLVNFVMTGKLNFADFAKSIIADIARMAAKMAVSGIAKLVLSALPGASAGVGAAGGAVGSAGSGIGSSVSSGVTALAARGMVMQGGIKMMAKGDVVNGPTTFPMSSGMGMIGDGGPEAAMPLKRLPNGNLGVYAEGGGGKGDVNQSIAVNVSVQGGTTNDQTGAAVSDAVVQAMRGIARDEMANANRNSQRR